MIAASTPASRAGKLAGFAPAVAFAAALAAPAARAQQTNTLSSLFLSSGAQVNFNFYGVNGGTGTNGSNSDLLSVTNQFNFSGAAPGSYIFGFSHGDTAPLIPGSVFTLITFGSTNFTPADISSFQATPRGNLSTINGSFLLNLTGGGSGSLQFQLDNSADLPEPSAMFLVLVVGTLGGALRLSTSRSPSFPDEKRWANLRT